MVGKGEEAGVGVGGSPTAEKEEGLQFQTSQGMNRKTRVPGWGSGGGGGGGGNNPPPIS